MVDMGEGRTTTTVYCSVTHVLGSPSSESIWPEGPRRWEQRREGLYGRRLSPAHAQTIPPLLLRLALPKRIIGDLAMTKSNYCNKVARMTRPA
jgi:hypothetical protein